MSPLTPVALLDKAAWLGAETVQICDNLPLDGLSETELVELVKRATALGLALEVGIRGSQPAHVRRYLEIAQQVGARVLRVVLAGPNWEPSFEESMAFLTGMVPELQAAGIALAIENRFSMLPAELARLVRAVDDPLVGVCLDPLNSITRLVGVGETVRALAPLALSVHAKDAVIFIFGVLLIPRGMVKLYTISSPFRIPAEKSVISVTKNSLRSIIMRHK